MKRFLLAILLFLPHATVQARALSFHHLTVEDGLPHNSTNAFVEDKFGFIWIATLEGLCRFDGEKITTYCADDTPNSLITQRPIRLYKDAQQDIWIAFSSDKGLCKYSYLDNNFERYAFDDAPQEVRANIWTANVLSQPFVSPDGKLEWSVIDNRLRQRNVETGDQYFYKSNPADLHSLSDSYVTASYLDRNNILWLGTDNGGVNYADLNIKQFDYHAIEGVNSVSAICEAGKDKLWVGTRTKGLMQFDFATGRTEPINYCNVSKYKESDRVRALFLDSKETLWIGTRNGLYAKDSQNIKRYARHTKPSIPNSRVYAITEDSLDLVWFCTWSGLASYSYEQDSLQCYEAEELHSIRQASVGGEGELWLATEHGLIFVNYQNDRGLAKLVQTTSYRPSSTENAQFNDFIYSLDIDHNGNVWLGTARGVLCFDKQAKEFRNIPELNALNNSAIFGILCNDDEVWISHGDGLVRYEQKLQQARQFDEQDGLKNLNFSEGASFRSKTGQLFFGGNNGMTSFYPHLIAQNTVAPQLIFTELCIDNKTIELHQEVKGTVLLKKPTALTDSLIFTHRHQSIELHFSALHFSNYQQNAYSHRLLGFDEQWTDPSVHNKSMRYSSLPPGVYKLQVKACNSDGIWADKPLELIIKVLPPWWRTWQAIAAYFLLIVVALSVFILRIHASKKPFQKLHPQSENERSQSDRYTASKAADEAFINKAVELVQQHLADTTFTPDIFAQELAVSRAQLFRKIKAMTGKTVVEFISTIRLNHAADLLLSSTKSISDIAIESGFSDASNFRRSFVKRFGKSPSEYRRQ